MDKEQIQQMLKLIPNNFPVCLEDLEEIFNQNEIQPTETMGDFRPVAKESSRM